MDKCWEGMGAYWVFRYDYLPYDYIPYSRSIWNVSSNCRPCIPMLVKVTCERHSSTAQPALCSRQHYACVNTTGLQNKTWWLTLKVQLWWVAYSGEVRIECLLTWTFTLGQPERLSRHSGSKSIAEHSPVIKSPIISLTVRKQHMNAKRRKCFSRFFRRKKQIHTNCNSGSHYSQFLWDIIVHDRHTDRQKFIPGLEHNADEFSPLWFEA